MSKVMEKTVKERFSDSSKSTNFWNNMSNIASLATLVILLNMVKEPQALHQMIWAFLASSGFHNVGNIISHLNADKK